MSAEYPEDLLYTEDHEWARIEGNVATVGITQFAVDKLGDVIQVDLPREGESLKQRDVFGSVESVKAVSDLFAPAVRQGAEGELAAVATRPNTSTRSPTTAAG